MQNPEDIALAALESARAEKRKTQLRAELKATRHAMPAGKRAAADVRIAEHVCATEAWQQAACVLAYLSFGSEVDTHALIERAWDADKTVALPRCVPNSRDMRWHRVTSFDALEKSTLGMREPADDTSTLIDPTACNPARTIALVPGLAFDAQGYRLGYGGGFYDTFLAQFTGTSLGLCRAAQLVGSLRDLGVTEPHDLPVDLVISDVSAR